MVRLFNGNSKTAITTVGAFDLLLGTNSTERMRITSAGGVSFGSSGTAYGSSGQVLTSNGIQHLLGKMQQVYL